jgi:hypothetical protein
LASIFMRKEPDPSVLGGGNVAGMRPALLGSLEVRGLGAFCVAPCTVTSPYRVFFTGAAGGVLPDDTLLHYRYSCP